MRKFLDVYSEPCVTARTDGHVLQKSAKQWSPVKYGVQIFETIEPKPYIDKAWQLVTVIACKPGIRAGSSSVNEPQQVLIFGRRSLLSWPETHRGEQASSQITSRLIICKQNRPVPPLVS